MPKYKRPAFNVLKERLEKESRRFIQVIYGPRQVGKTTMIHQIMADTNKLHHYASADAVAASDQLWISQQWEAARMKSANQDGDPVILIIDEVQKVDNWSEQVKKEWDRDSANRNPVFVVLLGSSRLLLQQGLTESLAGRFESTYMGHWSFSEMETAFGFTPEQYAWFGGYPGAASLIDDETRWKEYVRLALIETSVSKDILMQTRVDKPSLMKRLFEIGCSYSGQMVSFNKILGQLQDTGNTTTLSHYLHLLDTAGLLAGLPKYSPNIIRKRASSPKFQVHNTALISAQTQQPFQQVRSDPPRWGRWVESCVGAHLLNFSIKTELDLMYWRHGNDEVDFVIQKGDQSIGIEVKSGASGPTAGMQAFEKRFQPKKVLLIGEDGFPWQEFLLMDPADLF